LPLRLVFMGTPDFAVPTLLELIGAGHDVVAVYTRAPQPAGRGMPSRESPIDHQAKQRGIPTFTPKKLRDLHAVEQMRSHHAEAAVVVAYGLILPKPILESFPLGCFNLHASLLPRWRGAAPIQRAVMAGDRLTGVKVMRMDEGLDTGLVAIGKRMPIGPDTTTGDLHDPLAQLGADLMRRAMTALSKNHPWKFTPQSKRRPTYAHKIDKSETRIDWTQKWQEVHNRCRGLSPFPGAWFELANVGRIKVLHTTKGTGTGEPGQVLDDQLTVACGKGSVRLVKLQRAGGKPMPAEAFLRGTPVARGSVLG
jgi:methionyl-tRNA formyltransferase